MTEQLKSTLDFLRADRDRIKSELTTIEILIARYEGQLAAGYALPELPLSPTTPLLHAYQKESNGNGAATNFDPIAEFPKDAPLFVQIAYIIKGFGRFTKARDIEDRYTLYTKQQIGIGNPLRRMLSLHKVIMLKLNDSNKLSFWGLPEWIIDKDGNHLRYPVKDREPILEMPFDSYSSDLAFE